MRVVRMCTRAHPELDGVGASITGGRSHSQGTKLVHTASCSALAILEYRVHLSRFPKNMLLILIEISDGLEIERVTYIPNEIAQMRQIGNEWIQNCSTPVLEVPSVIAPRQKNYLLNPVHAGFADGVRVLESNPFAFDARLFLLWLRFEPPARKIAVTALPPLYNRSITAL